MTSEALPKSYDDTYDELVLSQEFLLDRADEWEFYAVLQEYFEPYVSPFA